jgi:hypothetical protein
VVAAGGDDDVGRRDLVGEVAGQVPGDGAGAQETCVQ